MSEWHVKAGAWGEVGGPVATAAFSGGTEGGDLR